MNVTTTSNLDITKYNGIIIPCFEGQNPSLETFSPQTATYLKANKFEGKYESNALFSIPLEETLVQYLFVGLGKKEELTVEKAMCAIGGAVKTFSKKELASVVVSFTEIEESILTEHFVLSVVKACSLACYAFDKFMEKEKAIETLLVDKDKFNVLFEGIKKILDSLTFEVAATETDTTNVNEIKDKKEEENDTR